MATIVTIEDKWFDRLFRLDGVRILLVEDQADVRDHVVSILETCGGTVMAVRSALTALEVLEHERPDVLVSNVAMPDRDGYWLIGNVRARSAARGGQTPAAAITAVATPEARAKILGSGFQFHVQTPIDPGRLAGVVALLALKE